MPTTNRATRPDATPAPWRPAALLGLAALACWIIPATTGHGRFRPAHLYLAGFATLTALACLAVAVAPARRRRPLAVRLMAVVASLVVALPIADLAATLWAVRVGNLWYYSFCYPRRENAPDPDLIWKRRPGLAWTGRKTPDCDEVRYRTDAHGFRNPPGLDRADLVVVGDSVTEAGEVSEDATFVRKAGAALGLSAANLGTSGYGPQQELAVLRRYGLPLRPRVVVWQFTEWNDLQDAQGYAHRLDPAARTLPTWGELYARHSPVARLAVALSRAERPNTVALVRADGRLERQAFWPYTPDLHRRLPEGFAEAERAIAAASAECRSRGIAFVVVYVPSHTRVLYASLRFRDEAERDRFCPGGLPDRDDDLAHALAAACDRIGSPLIDMTPPLRRRAAIDNRRLYVRNDPHLGVDGHDEVARAITQFVASTGLAARLPNSLRR